MEKMERLLPELEDQAEDDLELLDDENLSLYHVESDFTNTYSSIIEK